MITPSVIKGGLTASTDNPISVALNLSARLGSELNPLFRKPVGVDIDKQYCVGHSAALDRQNEMSQAISFREYHFDSPQGAAIGLAEFDIGNARHRGFGRTEADMPLTLSSNAFQQGGNIPEAIHVRWRQTFHRPSLGQAYRRGTRSFLIVCGDPDAPSGIFHHWAAYDIPPDWRRLAEGHGPESLANGFRQAINDFEKPGYAGPCPPRGDRPHGYHFRLSALSEASLPLGPSATCVEVIMLARPHVLEFVELIGLYGR